MEEIWKDIKGYEGKYQVSNTESVKSLKKTRSLILKAVDRGNGYLVVNLCIHSKQTTKYTHRLIAEAFIPNPENKPYVNHINGIKTDNRIENLEWCTRSENELHAHAIGLKGPSEKASLASKHACQIISNWFNIDTNTFFIGNSRELVRAFLEQRLSQGHLSSVRYGKRKHHKGWIVYKEGSC